MWTDFQRSCTIARMNDTPKDSESPSGAGKEASNGAGKPAGKADAKPARRQRNAVPDRILRRHGSAPAALKHWRKMMGHTLNRQPGPLYMASITMPYAAACTDTQARAWERWEAGLSRPPPCLWVCLEYLLKDVRKHGNLHAEDDPKNKLPPGSRVPQEWIPTTAEIEAERAADSAGKTTNPT